MAFVTLLFACLFSIGTILGDEDVVIEIPQGKLKGIKTETAYLEKTMFSFKGIPYAKPRLGMNKFDPSELADEPWKEVYDATEFGKECLGFCHVRQKVIGDEDCLYLNVYTPDVSPDAKLPVFFVIYSSNFMGGSGDDLMYGGDFAVEDDTVMVTFNYRLGAFGFISTGDANAPGNVAMKDQVLALRWVKKNIDKFGGDPDRITLWGPPSYFVPYHLISPMSRGLFHGAIISGGSAIAPISMKCDAKQDMMKIGEKLGIPTGDTSEFIAKLKATDSEKIAMVIHDLFEGGMEFTTPYAPFPITLVVEGDHGQEIFLPDTPLKLLNSGQIADVPVIMGTTSDEGVGLVYWYDYLTVEMVNSRLANTVPSCLNVSESTMNEIVNKMKNLYFGGGLPSNRFDPGVAKLIADANIVHGNVLSAKMMAIKNKSPVYQYIFTHDSPLGVFKNMFNIRGVATYFDDVNFMFYSNAFDNVPEKGSDDEKMHKVAMKLWTNFAKTGNPTPTMDDDIKTIWKPIEGFQDNYLDMNPTPSMKQGMFSDRMKVWAEIYNDALGEAKKFYL